MTLSRMAVCLLVVAFATPVAGQNLPPAKKNYEDPAVRIWYIHWARGGPSEAPFRPEATAVIVFLDDATLRLPSGVTQSHKAGDVISVERGSIANAGELVTRESLKALVVEIKDLQLSQLPKIPGVPPALPRAGATSVFENAVAKVWDVWYRPEQPLPTLLYTKNTVQVFLTDAVVERVYPNQLPHQNSRPRSGWEINHAGLVTSERVIGGPAHVIAIEHK